MSSPPILASSSLSLSSLSLANIFTLPTELLIVLLSCAKDPHRTEADPFPFPLPFSNGFGESNIITLPLILPFLPDELLDGIIMPFCVITGLESGELCSAMVEWCKFVHARLQSKPRECRGMEAAGEAERLLL